MRVVELFAGVGGFRIGFEGPPGDSDRSGAHVVWANQWEPSTNVQHAARVYIDRWGLEEKGEGIFSNGEDDVFVNLNIDDFMFDTNLLQKLSSSRRFGGKIDHPLQF